MVSPAQTEPVIVVYHADCIDGAASAWIIAKTIKDKNVTYIPYAHADSAASEDKIRSALVSGAEIYFADLTPEKPFLDELLSLARKVHILDHHQSAAARLAGYKDTPHLKIHINPESPSAAKMIWQHFFPVEKAPAIIDLISLMDGSGSGLQTPQDFAAAALVDSKYIDTTERAFNTLRGLAKLSFNEMAKKGRPIATDQEARIDEFLKNTSSAQVQILPDTEPVNVPIVNGDVKLFGRQISERLVALGKKSGVNVAFMWTIQKTGTVSLSIRTDGAPDASKIAEHLCKTMGATGGGHKDAAAVHFSSLFEFARQMPIRPSKTFENKHNPPLCP